jgi:hypothetical protein
MFDDIFKNLKESMKGLSDQYEQVEKKLNPDEIKFMNEYKVKVQKAIKDMDLTSLSDVTKDLQNFVNKQEKK